jgi:hypothetical protein
MFEGYGNNSSHLAVFRNFAVFDEPDGAVGCADGALLPVQ